MDTEGGVRRGLQLGVYELLDKSGHDLPHFIRCKMRQAAPKQDQPALGPRNIVECTSFNPWQCAPRMDQAAWTAVYLVVRQQQDIGLTLRDNQQSRRTVLWDHQRRLFISDRSGTGTGCPAASLDYDDGAPRTEWGEFALLGHVQCSRPDFEDGLHILGDNLKHSPPGNTFMHEATPKWFTFMPLVRGKDFFGNGPNGVLGSLFPAMPRKREELKPSTAYGYWGISAGGMGIINWSKEMAVQIYMPGTGKMKKKSPASRVTTTLGRSGASLSLNLTVIHSPWRPERVLMGIPTTCWVQDRRHETSKRRSASRSMRRRPLRVGGQRSGCEWLTHTGLPGPEHGGQIGVSREQGEAGRLPKLTWKHLLNKEILSHELKGEKSKTTLSWSNEASNAASHFGRLIFKPYGIEKESAAARIRLLSIHVTRNAQ
ncbi:hypothetical protein B0H17DRAFT_1133042 [Mycena rosella]|uniref:Uncharacterized protein n=1 Tax=Mycena rosella TaxID=1033263 RepID=A0AAD7GIJ9_MYCRO|nr:hypothetical protein B0H17DRAFT_1133042 [Mycena rosella]